MFTKVGLEFCPPSLYILLRFLTALIIASLVFHKHIKSIKKETLGHGLLLGLLFGGGFLLQTYGLSMTSVSKSAFITGITVPLTPFAYWLLERKKIPFWSFIGVVIALIGLSIFANPDFNNINTGDVLTLLSTFFWAFYISCMDKFTSGKSGIETTSQLVILQFVAAVPLALLFFFIFDYQSFYFEPSYKLLGSLAFNAILASFFVTLIHTSYQRFTTPVKAALIFSLEPIVASITAWAVFSEILSARELLGACILLSGVLISETGGFISKKFPSLKKI